MKRPVTALLAASVVMLATSVAVMSPISATVPAHAAAAAQRVYMVTDSVGLGAKNAVPAAFPADWQVTVDGTPALFVEQLESKHVRGQMAANPGVFGDYAVVAGGYNYPYWDPDRFDRSIDGIIRAFEEAGVKYVFWVTLREIDPAVHHHVGLEPGPAVLLVLPHRQRSPPCRRCPPSEPVADRLGGDRRPARADLRRHSPQHVRRSRIRGEHRQGGHVDGLEAGGRVDHHGQGGRCRRRAGRRDGRVVEPHRDQPESPGFPHHVSVRRAPPGCQQRQLHQRQHRRRGGDRSCGVRRNRLRVHQRGDAPDRRRDGFVLGNRFLRPRRPDAADRHERSR